MVIRSRTGQSYFSVTVIIQLLSCVQHFATLWTAAGQASLSFTISGSLLKLMSIESVIPSNHLVLCRPLLLFSIFSSIRVFSNQSALCIRWPKYWSFSFKISLSNEYSGLISFRIDWLDLLAVQGTLKESSPTPQFKSINSSAFSLLYVFLYSLHKCQSVQFSLSVVSDFLQPHGLQHTRPPCPSPTLELPQTHTHRVSNAVQPSHPLSSSCPPAFDLSQHQGLY